MPAEPVHRPDHEHRELAAVGVIEHLSQRLAVLALVRGGVRDLIAPCDLPAAVFAVAFEVGDLVVLVLGGQSRHGPRSLPSCSLN